MNDDPDRVDVLYGQIIDGSGRLQRLSDALVSSLEAEGLLDRQYDHVKLHATLMNSLFASKDDDQLQKGNRQTFRAKTILEVYSLKSKMLLNKKYLFFCYYFKIIIII